ncbi:MAG: phospholipase [Nitrospirae bacterium]|nr:phospholipase [Nitrospirota bacterium]
MIKRLIAILLAVSFLFPAFACSEQQTLGPVSPEGNGVLVLEDSRYLDSLLDKINQAQSGILVSMYIFKTTGKKKSASNKVKDALIKAAKRGVKVKVILEEEEGNSSSLNNDNRITAGKLTNGGVKVFFDSPNRRTHVKAIVIDDRYTFIGSHNLTASALQYNKELSLMIDSLVVAKRTTGYIEDMMTRAHR